MWTGDSAMGHRRTSGSPDAGTLTEAAQRDDEGAAGQQLEDDDDDPQRAPRPEAQAAGCAVDHLRERNAHFAVSRAATCGRSGDAVAVMLWRPLMAG